MIQKSDGRRLMLRLPLSIIRVHRATLYCVLWKLEMDIALVGASRIYLRYLYYAWYEPAVHLNLLGSRVPNYGLQTGGGLRV